VSKKKIKSLKSFKKLEREIFSKYIFGLKDDKVLQKYVGWMIYEHTYFNFNQIYKMLLFIIKIMRLLLYSVIYIYIYVYQIYTKILETNVYKYLWTFGFYSSVFHPM